MTTNINYQVFHLLIILTTFEQEKIFTKNKNPIKNNKSLPFPLSQFIIDGNFAYLYKVFKEKLP